MLKQPKAIARIAKLHRNDLSGSGSHTLRQRETPNADFDRKNIRLLGPNDPNVRLQDLVMAKIAEHPQKRKIRTDAVYCVELLLSASPEYFRPSQPEQYGVYDPERLERWVDENMKWLKEECRYRLVLAELHLDETTPHIEAYMVPLDENGQLNCRSLFGGREKMQAFQDNYAAAMAPLEIARGLPGSRANHWKIKQFYENINQSETLDAELSIDQLKAKAADRDRAVEDKESMEQTAQAIADRNKTLEQQVQVLQTGADQVVAEENKQLKQSVQELEDKVRSFEQEASRWQSMYQKLADKLQAKPLMQSVGSVDLELELQSETNGLSKRDDQQWTTVQKHLTEQYGFPPDLLNHLHEQGWLYADKRKRAVFIERDLDDENYHGLILSEAGHLYPIEPNSEHCADSSFWIGTGEPFERAVIVNNPLEVLAAYSLDERNRDVPTLYLAATRSEQIPSSVLQEIPQVLVSETCSEQMRQSIEEQIPQAQLIAPNHSESWCEVWVDAAKANQRSHRQRRLSLQSSPRSQLQL